ncbi:MAG: NEW3 domain-containing protein [Actinomycetota bacterium]
MTATMLAAIAPSHPALAAPGLQLLTPYPAVNVEAGRSVTFNVEVKTPARQRVDLAVAEAPQGWQATLRGGGFEVHSVFGAPQDPPQVQLEVRIPADAAKNTYRIVVRGTSGGVTDSLEFDLTVAETVSGAVTLTPETPTLRGPSSTNFRENVTLTNNTPEAATFNLSGEGPPGWDVTVQPTGQSQAAAVKVDPGATTTLEVSADPPDNVAADSYQVKVRATSGSQSAETTITAEVTGNTKITLTTPTRRLNAKATAGRTTDLRMSVLNEGNTTARAVKLSSSPPSGWKVSFGPSTVPDVGANKSQAVTARITPSGDAVAGDYVVTMTASGGGANSDADIRVTVETSRLWGVLGLLVIAAAIGGLLAVFRKYGRR